MNRNVHLVFNYLCMIKNSWFLCAKLRIFLTFFRMTFIISFVKNFKMFIVTTTKQTYVAIISFVSPIWNRVLFSFLGNFFYEAFVPKMRKKASNQGLTLIEMMIVFAILTILVSIAIPNYLAWLPKSRLNGATRQVMGDLMAARMKAVSQNVNCVLTFTTDTDNYTVFLDDGSGAGTAKNWQQDGSEITIKSVTITNEYKGIDLYNASFSGGSTVCGFNPMGLPISNRIGSVYLKNNTGQYKRIALSSVGKINVYASSDGENWN